MEAFIDARQAEKRARMTFGSDPKRPDRQVQNVHLRRDVEQCNETNVEMLVRCPEPYGNAHLVVLLQENIRNKLAPVVFEANVTIGDQEHSSAPLRPVLDAFSDTSFSTEVRIKVNCPGANMVCTPDQKLDVEKLVQFDT